MGEYMSNFGGDLIHDYFLGSCSMNKNQRILKSWCVNCFGNGKNGYKKRAECVFQNISLNPNNKKVEHFEK
jgi:hypothetical protein